jgi:hypothetical protein
MKGRGARKENKLLERRRERKESIGKENVKMNVTNEQNERKSRMKKGEREAERTKGEVN